MITTAAFRLVSLSTDVILYEPRPFASGKYSVRCNLANASRIFDSAGLDAPIKQYVIDLMEPCEFVYSGGTYQNEVFKYRLFVPKGMKDGKRYPLLIWTCGYGERGNDNLGQLMHLDHVFPDKANLEQYDFFVLAMQTPVGEPPWFRRPGPSLPDEPATVLMEIARNLQTKYPIDRDRLYLSGVSAGGGACWEIGMRYPKQFAAMVPMASPGADMSDIDRLSKLAAVPIWVFHCRDDPAIPISGDRETVDAIRHLGGNISLTEIEGASHDCWTTAFRDYGAMEWMLANARGQKGVPPGIRPWKWWNYGAIAVVPLLVWLIVRSERRRRSVIQTAQ